MPMRPRDGACCASEDETPGFPAPEPTRGTEASRGGNHSSRARAIVPGFRWRLFQTAPLPTTRVPATSSGASRSSPASPPRPLATNASPEICLNRRVPRPPSPTRTSRPPCAPRTSPSTITPTSPTTPSPTTPSPDPVADATMAKILISARSTRLGRERSTFASQNYTPGYEDALSTKSRRLLEEEMRKLRAARVAESEAETGTGTETETVDEDSSAEAAQSGAETANRATPTPPRPPRAARLCFRASVAAPRHSSAVAFSSTETATKVEAAREDAPPRLPPPSGLARRPSTTSSAAGPLPPRLRAILRAVLLHRRGFPSAADSTSSNVVVLRQWWRFVSGWRFVSRRGETSERGRVRVPRRIATIPTRRRRGRNARVDDETNSSRFAFARRVSGSCARRFWRVCSPVSCCGR